jgi:hypothetical protein
VAVTAGCAAGDGTAGACHGLNPRAHTLLAMKGGALYMGPCELSCLPAASIPLPRSPWRSPQRAMSLARSGPRTLCVCPRASAAGHPPLKRVRTCANTAAAPHVQAYAWPCPHPSCPIPKPAPRPAAPDCPPDRRRQQQRPAARPHNRHRQRPAIQELRRLRRVPQALP